MTPKNQQLYNVLRVLAKHIGFTEAEANADPSFSTKDAVLSYIADPYTSKFRVEWPDRTRIHKMRHGSVGEAWEALLTEGLVCDAQHLAWTFTSTADATAHPYPWHFWELLQFASYGAETLRTIEIVTAELLAAIEAAFLLRHQDPMRSVVWEMHQDQQQGQVEDVWMIWRRLEPTTMAIASRADEISPNLWSWWSREMLPFRTEFGPYVEQECELAGAAEDRGRIGSLLQRLVALGVGFEWDMSRLSRGPRPPGSPPGWRQYRAKVRPRLFFYAPP